MKKFILVTIFLLSPGLIQANIGVTTVNWLTVGKSLKVMIWYPAQATKKPAFDYYGFVKGQANFEAELLMGKYPLLVFSHGLGMCSFQSVFLMEYLAANGYVVAAPDHDDAAMCHIGGGSDVTDWQLTKAMLKSGNELDNSVQELFPDKLFYLMDPAYRPQQISLVINKLLTDAKFGLVINPNQIGVMGHSFGGWTAESLAGAEIDCRNPGSYAPSVCEAPDQALSTSVNLLKICCQEKYKGQITNFRDTLVKASLAFGPGSFIFPNYETMNNQVPVMIILGDHFEVDFMTSGYEAVHALNSPNYLMVWHNVGHMTVSDLVYNKPGAHLLKQFWCYNSKKKLYQDWSLGFFQAYLQSDFSLLHQNLIQPYWLKFYLEQH